VRGRKQSRGRELAINNPARPSAEGDDALDFRRLLEALLAKYDLHVAVERPIEHGVQVRTCEGRDNQHFFYGNRPAAAGTKAAFSTRIR
jgi:hypothetical protein